MKEITCQEITETLKTMCLTIKYVSHETILK